MKLLLDFGNSRCKWALLDKEQFSDSGAISYADDGGQPQLAAVTQQLPLVGINSIHIVSVLGKQLDAQIAKVLAPYNYHFYTSQLSMHGVKLAYADATQYGNDRYAALLAAHHSYTGNKLIVDCGTAITLDGLTAGGEHMGGVILPSYANMLLALNTGTQRLPIVQESDGVQLFSKSTTNAIASGSLLCLQQGLSAIIQQMKRYLGDDCILIATGGNHKQMLVMLSEDYIDVPNLVLEGLALLTE